MKAVAIATSGQVVIARAADPRIDWRRRTPIKIVPPQLLNRTAESTVWAADHGDSNREAFTAVGGANYRAVVAHRTIRPGQSPARRLSVPQSGTSGGCPKPSSSVGSDGTAHPRWYLSSQPRVRRTRRFRTDGKGIPPWALAEIAPVSVLRGTEFNRAPATTVDLNDCANAFLNLDDRDLRRHTPGEVGDFLLRVGSQQLTWQQQTFHDISRAAAVFQHAADPKRPPKVITGDWPKQLFGCSLVEYLNLAFLLHVGALRNQAIFDPAWIDTSQFEDIRKSISGKLMREVYQSQFVADQERLRADQAEVERAVGKPELDYRRFG